MERQKLLRVSKAGIDFHYPWNWKDEEHNKKTQNTLLWRLFKAQPCSWSQWPHLGKLALREKRTLHAQCSSLHIDRFHPIRRFLQHARAIQIKVDVCVPDLATKHWLSRNLLKLRRKQSSHKCLLPGLITKGFSKWCTQTRRLKPSHITTD